MLCSARRPTKNLKKWGEVCSRPVAFCGGIPVTPFRGAWAGPGLAWRGALSDPTAAKGFREFGSLHTEELSEDPRSTVLSSLKPLCASTGRPRLLPDAVPRREVDGGRGPSQPVERREEQGSTLAFSPI